MKPGALALFNDYLLFFFDGRDSDGPQQPGDWVADSAMKLGSRT